MFDLFFPSNSTTSIVPCSVSHPFHLPILKQTTPILKQTTPIWNNPYFCGMEVPMCDETNLLWTVGTEHMYPHRVTQFEAAYNQAC